ncbi:MAG: hypothetical protein S4CHLAM20_12260 [Chlamydiia bacterium]|nr:hypothetical protein [Chlamydiia bacterium]
MENVNRADVRVVSQGGGSDAQAPKIDRLPQAGPAASASANVTHVAQNKFSQSQNALDPTTREPALNKITNHNTGKPSYGHTADFLLLTKDLLPKQRNAFWASLIQEENQSSKGGVHSKEIFVSRDLKPLTEALPETNTSILIGTFIFSNETVFVYCSITQPELDVFKREKEENKVEVLTLHNAYYLTVLGLPVEAFESAIEIGVQKLLAKGINKNVLFLDSNFQNFNTEPKSDYFAFSASATCLKNQFFCFVDLTIESLNILTTQSIDGINEPFKDVARVKGQNIEVLDISGRPHRVVKTYSMKEFYEIHMKKLKPSKKVDLPPSAEGGGGTKTSSFEEPVLQEKTDQPLFRIHPNYFVVAKNKSAPAIAKVKKALEKHVKDLNAKGGVKNVYLDRDLKIRTGLTKRRRKKLKKLYIGEVTCGTDVFKVYMGSNNVIETPYKIKEAHVDLSNEVEWYDIEYRLIDTNDFIIGSRISAFFSLVLLSEIRSEDPIILKDLMDALGNSAKLLVMSQSSCKNLLISEDFKRIKHMDQPETGMLNGGYITIADRQVKIFKEISEEEQRFLEMLTSSSMETKDTQPANLGSLVPTTCDYEAFEYLANTFNFTQKELSLKLGQFIVGLQKTGSEDKEIFYSPATQSLSTELKDGYVIFLIAHNFPSGKYGLFLLLTSEEARKIVKAEKVKNVVNIMGDQVTHLDFIAKPIKPLRRETRAQFRQGLKKELARFESEGLIKPLDGKNLNFDISECFEYFTRNMNDPEKTAFWEMVVSHIHDHISESRIEIERMFVSADMQSIDDSWDEMSSISVMAIMSIGDHKIQIFKKMTDIEVIQKPQFVENENLKLLQNLKLERVSGEFSKDSCKSSTSDLAQLGKRWGKEAFRATKADVTFSVKDFIRDKLYNDFTAGKIKRPDFVEIMDNYYKVLKSLAPGKAVAQPKQKPLHEESANGNAQDAPSSTVISLTKEELKQQIQAEADLVKAQKKHDKDQARRQRIMAKRAAERQRLNPSVQNERSEGLADADLFALFEDEPLGSSGNSGSKGKKPTRAEKARKRAEKAEKKELLKREAEKKAREQQQLEALEKQRLIREAKKLEEQQAQEKERQLLEESLRRNDATLKIQSLFHIRNAKETVNQLRVEKAAMTLIGIQNRFRQIKAKRVLTSLRVNKAENLIANNIQRLFHARKAKNLSAQLREERDQRLTEIDKRIQEAKRLIEELEPNRQDFTVDARVKDLNRYCIGLNLLKSKMNTELGDPNQGFEGLPVEIRNQTMTIYGVDY